MNDNIDDSPILSDTAIPEDSASLLEDGIIDGGVIDQDGDGAPEGWWLAYSDGSALQVLDLDDDGSGDLLQLDTDGDGALDLSVQPVDGGYEVTLDADRDGYWDGPQFFTHEDLQAQAPALVAVIDEVWGTGADPDQLDPTPQQQDDDGQPSERQVFDVTGDGLSDGEVRRLSGGELVTSWDVNHDGVVEVVSIDSNGDRHDDISVTRTADGYEIGIDSDFNGIEDRTVQLTRAELAQQAPSLLAVLDEAWPPETDPTGLDPAQDDGGLIGNPEAMADQWDYQGFDGACGPASIAQLLSLYTGEDVSRLEVIEAVTAQGEWTPTSEGQAPGMVDTAMADVLDSYGLEADVLHNLTVDDLSGYLADGHGILVTVDASEYWSPLLGEGDHAITHVVTVTGIDEQAGIVYLNDTGWPDGAAMEVPLDEFENAWEDGANTAIVIEESAQDYREENGIPLDDRIVQDAETPTTVDDADATPIDQQALVADETAHDAQPVPLGLGEQAGSAGPLDGVQDFLFTHSVVLLPIVLAGTAFATGFAARARQGH